MADHLIRLEGYRAFIDGSNKTYLELGTYDSYGLERIRIIRKGEWETADVCATFSSPNGRKTTAPFIGSDVIDIPPEALSECSGRGQIVFTGSFPKKRIISADLSYIVRPHSDIFGCEAEDLPIGGAQAFFSAAEEIKKIAQSVRDDADAGKFNGKGNPVMTNIDIEALWNQAQK